MSHESLLVLLPPARSLDMSSCVRRYGLGLPGPIARRIRQCIQLSLEAENLWACNHGLLPNYREYWLCEYWKLVTYWDLFQFKCCGNDGPLDYKNVVFPPSCCPNDNLVHNTCAITQSYNTGCKSVFHAFWSKNIEIIKFAGLGIALVEFVGLVFACCLANSIRNERRRARYW